MLVKLRSLLRARKLHDLKTGGQFDLNVLPEWSCNNKIELE